MSEREVTQHRIVTMAALVDAANDDNVEDLVADLGEWLRWHLTIRPLEKIVTMRASEFVWTDDGKPRHVARVIIEPRPSQEEEEQ